MLLDKANQLKIIFLTDIHLNYKGVDKLQQWVNIHYNTQPKFDYCLIGGDTANCNYQKNNHDEQQMYEETLAILKKIKIILGCKILSIPGNHDCVQFFKDDARKNDIFINIHNRVVELSQGLQIVGFGGSVPAYEAKNRNQINQEVFWAGFPYNNEQDLEKQWMRGSLSKVFNKNGQQSYKNQLIMLTHIGPTLSETTFDSSQLFPSSLVSTGSHFLNQFATRKQICLWLHGHTHKGSKMSRYGDLLIMNPGAIKCDQFMYFEVIKEEGKWKLSTKVFEAL